MHKTINILEDMTDIKNHILTIKNEKIYQKDTLNQRSIDISFAFSYLFEKVNEEYIKNNVKYVVNNLKDLFKILVINNFEENQYTNNFKIPFNDLNGCENLILSKELKILLKNTIQIFVPQNQRELNLIRKINDLNDKDFMDELYKSYSLYINEKELEEEKTISDIYSYNSTEYSFNLNDLMIFTTFIKSYKDNKYPLFNSVLSPDNLQYTTVSFKDLKVKVKG